MSLATRFRAALELVGIRIDLPLTELVARRAVAALVDYGIYFGLVFAYIRFLGDQTEEGWQVSSPIGIPFVVFLWFALFPLTETLFDRSLGKAMLGLSIETLRGRPADFFQHLQRRLLDPLDLLALQGLVAVIAVAMTAERQRLGDIWAGTRVVLRSKVCPSVNEPGAA